MKIDNKILSLPPYISTSWNNITALHMEGDTLIINLIDGNTIKVPSLDKETMNQIFEAHAKSIEKEAKYMEEISSPFSIFQGMDENNVPFRVGFSAINEIGTAMQHNPDQSNLPDLPEEMLEKIKEITKIFTPGNTTLLPKPESQCNCIHCQVARTIHDGIGHPIEESPNEIEVSEEDLKFQQWEIIPKGDKVFSVVNRLDPKEKYDVFLGNPVGCTCGSDGCEHIVAVLKS